MKIINPLTYLLLSLSILFSIKSIGQEMLIGGNMENAESWITSPLNMDTDNSVTFDFNYTDDKPASGAGGCLHISGTNTGTTGGNLTNFMFYQLVTLERGVTYNFTGAYKDIRTDNYWCEVYTGGNEPAIGSDYASAQGGTLIYGFKSTSWESACPTDEFDGTFETDACTPGSTNGLVLYEGTGDTNIYVGFRMGIWDDGTHGWTFETFIDNISLTKSVSNSTDLTTVNITVFPNPASDQVMVSLNSNILQIEFVNIFGQTVLTMKDINSIATTIDISKLNPGLYYIKVEEGSGKSIITKTLKF